MLSNFIIRSTAAFGGTPFRLNKCTALGSAGAGAACGAIKNKSESELFIELHSGGVIHYKSGDKPDNLRTETLNGVIIDEVREQSPTLWSMVIRPMLATTGGWAVFTSTTNGFDEFYDLHQRALTDINWYSIQAPSTCNPLFTQEELEECRNTMSPDEFRQEIMAEFVEVHSGKAYPNYSEQTHQTDINPFTGADSISPHLPIILGCDFNFFPMSWVMGQQRLSDFYWFDEIFSTRKSTQTPEQAEEFVKRYKANNLKNKVIIIGDASGKAGQRNTGESDYDSMCAVFTAAEIKWENRTPETNPSIKDRVNAVNAKWQDANGTVHMWHHSRCKFLKRDFQRVKFKDTGRLIEDAGTNRDLGHISSAAGYAVHLLSPIPSIRQPGVVRMITR